MLASPFRCRSISRRIALLVGVLFLLAAVVLVYVINTRMKRNALDEARVQARIIFDRNLALHNYFSRQLKPQLFADLGDRIDQGYFDPVWMSSTYAVRMINTYSRALEELEYSYKESAINARNPDNEADPDERAFIHRLNRERQLTEVAKLRSIDGKPVFQVLRRGETMEHSCLRCHGSPDVAPAGLVARYGPSRGFGRKLGEVVSAVSIRVPLAAAYAQADRMSLQLSLLLILMLAGVYLLQLWLQRSLIFSPLGRIAGLVEKIAGRPERLGEQLPAVAGRELVELTTAFNSMSHSLREGLDRLHDQAAQLQVANCELQQSEAQYRGLVAGIHAAVIVHDADTAIRISNPLAQQLLGQSEAQLLGRTASDPVWKFLREDGSSMPMAEYPVCQVLASGQPLGDLVVGIRRPDLPEPLWVLVNADPVMGGDGEVLQVIVTFVDLTERRRIDRRLELLDHALNQVREAAFLVDEQARFRYVNAEACRRLGYSREELLQLRVADIDPDVSQESWPAHLAKARSSCSLSFESRHRTKGGEIFPVDINASFFEYDGQAYLLGLVRDVSDARQAASELAREKALLRCIIDSASDLIYIKDRDGVYRGCNKASERFTGLSEAEQVGRSDFEFFSRERADQIRVTDRQVIETGKAQRIEEWVTYPDGHHVLLDTLKVPFIGPEGEALGLVGISRDITERKRGEELLREKETFIRNILDTVDEGIIVVDRDYRILAANQAFCKLADRSQSQVLGQPCHLVSHQKETPCFENGEDCAVRRCFETGSGQSATHLHTDAAGETHAVELKTYPLSSADGTIVSVIETIADVTDQRKLEAQLRQAQKLEAVGRLAGGVAHDFNNMLGVIIGHTEMALRRVDTDDRLHIHLQEIDKAAERSADLTRQLLAFARKQAVTPRVLDLNRTVDGMLKMLQRLIGEDMELAWQPGAKLWPVRIDPSQVDQILANLCVNARDAIDGTGRICVTTANLHFAETGRVGHLEIAPGDYVLMTVSDDGCGMEKATLDRVFEPFFTTKEQGRGTGLGLATIYGIVKQNHGFIYVDSAPGQGSTFSIYLPRYTGSDLQAERLVPEPAALEGQETLLLVEDEAAILDILRLALEELGYQVLVASSPAEARQLALDRDCAIDLLITDVIMPGMNGRELAQQLQSRCPNLRCLYVSGYTNDSITRHGVLDEGVNFIQKPFTMQVLASKVREILDA